MIKIIGISGSLRAGFYNTALLRTSAELIKDLAVLEIILINNISLYNEDIENSEGIPQAVTSLQNKISSANGIILATHEYNHSTGCFKKYNRLVIAATGRNTPNI